MEDEEEALLTFATSATAGQEIGMNRIRLLFSLVCFCFVPTLFNSQAFAQCGGVAKHAAFPVYRGTGGGLFHLAAAGQESEVADDEERGEYGLEPIVGLWKMDFEDPADKYSDKGYSVWHSDHTEFLNSTRAPSVGAVCQGVWEKVGRSTYRLNHFAMGYGDGVNLTSVYRFQLLVTVERGRNTFSGTFSIEAFDPKTHGSQGTFKGTVSGEKVKIDTSIDSQTF